MRKTPCYLMRLMGMVDSYKPPRTKDPGEISMSYISRYTLDIDLSMYTSKTFNYPLVLNMSTDYVKRTSRKSTIQLKENGRSSTIAMLSWINVNVDLETRQPKPFPDWWKQKYDFPSDGPTIDIQVPMKPISDVFLDKTVVRFTDIDSNNHTNYVSYVKMCLDVFYDGVLRKKYPHGSDVFLNGWLKSLSIVFKSDSVWGDGLRIESWQDARHHDKFHFEVINKGKVAVILTLQFYTSLVDKSRL